MALVKLIVVLNNSEQVSASSMIPSCSNLGCSQHNRPMKKRADAESSVFVCEGCGAQVTINPQTPSAPPPPPDTMDEQLLDQYYLGYYGLTYREYLNSGKGPFDNRRR